MEFIMSELQQKTYVFDRGILLETWHVLFKCSYWLLFGVIPSILFILYADLDNFIVNLLSIVLLFGWCFLFYRGHHILLRCDEMSFLSHLLKAFCFSILTIIISTISYFILLVIFVSREVLVESLFVKLIFINDIQVQVFYLLVVLSLLLIAPFALVLTVFTYMAAGVLPSFVFNYKLNFYDSWRRGLRQWKFLTTQIFLFIIIIAIYLFIFEWGSRLFSGLYTEFFADPFSMTHSIEREINISYILYYAKLLFLDTLATAYFIVLQAVILSRVFIKDYYEQNGEMPE